MLRKIVVNRKTVPVPVPIRTLGDLFLWIGQTLVLPGHSITQVTLDGKDVSEHPNPAIVELGTAAQVEFRIESPEDLAVQTIEAAINLSSVVQRSLKGAAVECWQVRPKSVPVFVDSILSDLDLILELGDHFAALINGAEHCSGRYFEIASEFKQVFVGLQMAKSQSDWRGYARLLLQRLEPLLGELAAELGAAELSILNKRSSRLTRSADTTNYSHAAKV